MGKCERLHPAPQTRHLPTPHQVPTRAQNTAANTVSNNDDSMKQAFVPPGFPDPPAPQCRNALVDPRYCTECTGVHLSMFTQKWEDPAVAQERLLAQMRVKKGGS